MHSDFSNILVFNIIYTIVNLQIEFKLNFNVLLLKIFIMFIMFPNSIFQILCYSITCAYMFFYSDSFWLHVS